jgi:hypothetical protein
MLSRFAWRAGRGEAGQEGVARPPGARSRPRIGWGGRPRKVGTMRARSRGGRGQGEFWTRCTASAERRLRRVLRTSRRPRRCHACAARSAQAPCMAHRQATVRPDPNPRSSPTSDLAPRRRRTRTM